MQYVIGIIVLLAMFGNVFFLYATTDTVEDCVVKTERVVDGQDAKYLVFGKKEVYENVDSFVRFKFNSSDFYRDIENGKCYKFKVQGWRVPFFSWYRNIFGIEK